MAITPERLKELAEKHGQIEHVKGGREGDEFVLRNPSRAEYKVFRAAAHQPHLAPDAQENLVRSCMVEPEGGPAIDALFDRWRAAADHPETSAAINRLVGMVVETLSK